MVIYALKKIRRIYHDVRNADQKMAAKRHWTGINKLRNQIFANERNIKLHIGCGPRVLKGWINIDLKYCPFENYLQYYTDEFYPPQIRGTEKNDFYSINLTKEPLPFPDNCVDVIFHEDFIEHLTQRSQFLFLSEMLRIMKPGAVHRVNTPNILVSMKSHSEFDKGFNGVFVEEWDRHGHLNVLSPAILEEMARAVGYSKILFNSRNSSISSAIPCEYRPSPNSRTEDGNIFADLIK